MILLVIDWFIVNYHLILLECELSFKSKFYAESNDLINNNLI